MKKLHIVIYSLALATIGLPGCATQQKAEKQYALADRKPGTPFSADGTITKHGVDICMSGAINYDLHQRETGPSTWLSAHYPPQGQIKDRLSLLVLQQAAKDPKKVVHAQGTIAEGPEGPHCRYVVVTRVTPVSQ
jgi:hypothetical protein